MRAWRSRLLASHFAGVLLALVAAGPLAAAGPASGTLPSLPAEAWDVAAQARGVQFNGESGQQPELQIVCDAHCPYCARLYTQLRSRFQDVAVRWVPVAYFRPDSAALAAAILSADDPAAALDENYRHYDAAQRRGGYRQLQDAGGILDYEHELLRQGWRAWGGFTPMVMVRDRSGQVFRARDASPASIRQALSVAGRGAGD